MVAGRKGTVRKQVLAWWLLAVAQAAGKGVRSTTDRPLHPYTSPSSANSERLIMADKQTTRCCMYATLLM